MACTMATMRELEELILKRRVEGCTYLEISDELRRKFLISQLGYSPLGHGNG